MPKEKKGSIEDQIHFALTRRGLLVPRSVTEVRCVERIFDTEEVELRPPLGDLEEVWKRITQAPKPSLKRRAARHRRSSSRARGSG